MASKPPLATTEADNSGLNKTEPLPVSEEEAPSDTTGCMLLHPEPISALDAQAASGVLPPQFRARSNSGGDDASDPVENVGTLVEHDVTLLAQQFRQSYDEFMSTTTKPNVLVVGTTGAGKSSLINSIFGQRLAQEGAGQPITTQFTKYDPEGGNVVIYDSRGLEHGNTAMFIEDTQEFFRSLPPEGAIQVVWYVINGAGSRIQHFEEEICRTLFADVPLLFVINKADISSDEDRAILRATLEGLQLPSCVGIFDAVSGDHAKVLNVTQCPRCKSDDFDIRKKLKTATCLACDMTIPLSVTLDNVIAQTLNVLPKLARERFIAAQTTSCRHKDARAKTILREYYEQAARTHRAKTLLREIASMFVRLSVLWDFREDGKAVSAELAEKLFTREYAFGSQILLFLRTCQGERTRTTAMGVLWNRCLRKTFVYVFVNTLVTNPPAPTSSWRETVQRETVQRCFGDMNDAEHTAVVNWLEQKSLASLLEREMPDSPDTVVPAPLVSDADKSPMAAATVSITPTPMAQDAATRSLACPSPQRMPRASENAGQYSPGLSCRRCVSPMVGAPVVVSANSATPVLVASKSDSQAQQSAPLLLQQQQTMQQTVQELLLADVSDPLAADRERRQQHRVILPGSLLSDPVLTAMASAALGAQGSGSAPTSAASTEANSEISSEVDMDIGSPTQSDAFVPAPAAVPAQPVPTVTRPVRRDSVVSGVEPAVRLDARDLAELDKVAEEEVRLNSEENSDVQKALLRPVPSNTSPPIPPQHM